MSPSWRRWVLERPLEVGDRFKLCGPTGFWQPGSRCKWQPRAWTGHPGAAGSQPIQASDLRINLGEAFTIAEIHVSARHRSTHVSVNRENVWINIQMDDEPWAYNPDMGWAYL